MNWLLKLLRFAVGYYVLSADESHRASLGSLLLEKEIAAVAERDGVWVLGRREAKRLQPFLNEKRAWASLSEIKGLPHVLKQRKRSAGLLVGFLLAWCFVLYTSGLVWRVDVSGNDAIPAEEIRMNLAELGLTAGASIDKIDTVTLSETYRLLHSDIAHMDVYFVGTVAKIRVMEAENGEIKEPTSPVSLVASRDAVIRSFDVHHGKIVIKEGAVVKAGDLLVSGFTEGANEDIFLHAEGKVYGEVSEDIVVEIPLKTTRNIVKGSEAVSFEINFLGKIIKFCRNSGKMVSTYGTIVERDILMLPNGKTLPFSILKTTAVYYETEEYRLTEKEATRLALSAMNGKLQTLLTDGYLVTKSVSSQLTEDTCLVKCTVTYVTNIAKEQQIPLS